MATTHFNPPPAKRVKVQSDDSPQPRWLLVPTASRTIQDLLKSLLLRLGLPGTSAYDLYLDGAPILPNEDIALVRDGEQLHLRLRDSPTATLEQSQPSDPHLSATSTPENDELPKKRKRILTPEGKRRRNARNRRREKRRRLERRESKDEDVAPVSTNPQDSVQVKDPLQNDATEIQRQQPQSHDMDAERNPTQENDDRCKEDSPTTENCAPAEPATSPNGHAQQNRNEAEVPERVMEISPASPTPGVNSYNSRQEQHLPNGNSLRLVLATVPPSRRDYSPPNTRVPAESGSHSAVCPGIHLEKPNTLFSYVLLKKVSIEPLANEELQKESIEVRKETGSPVDVQNGSDVITPIEERPTFDRPADQVACDGTSGLIPCIAEIRSSKKVLAYEPEEPSAKRKTNPSGSREKQPVAAGIKDVNFRVRTKAEIKNAVSTGDRAGNDLGFGASNAKTNEQDSSPRCMLMEIDNRSVDNPLAAAATRVVDREETQEATPAKQSCSGNLSDKVEHYRNINPRWKRRRLRGKKGNRDRPEARSEPAPDAPNGEPSLTPQRKDRDQHPDESPHPVCPEQVTKPISTSAHVYASEAKTTVCDIIDLVDDDEENAPSFDNLPVLQPPRTPEDRSASTSPQTIVVSPAEPQARDLRTTYNEVELVKACSGQPSKEGLGVNIKPEGEETRQHPVSTGGPRRKPARPTRLNKPESQSNNVNVIGSASKDTSHQEENLETLETLKRAVVRDLQSGRRETSALDKNPIQSLKETPVQRIPEAAKNLSEKGISSQESRRDAKRQRNALRGGLSTIEALRVAKAHAAIRLGSPKEMNGTCLENRDPAWSKANEDVVPTPAAINSTAGCVKDTARKKRRRKRGSGKSRRYLTEEQVNRSIFVGHRPETLLPPPELLELPEGADDPDQSGALPGVLPDTCCNVPHSYVEPSDEQKEVQPASQAKSLGNADENLSLQKVTEEANRTNRSQSFNLEKPIEEEPAPPFVDEQEEYNKISVQISPGPQEACDAERANGAGKLSGTGKSDAAPHYPIRSPSVDCFRQDLVNMLQDTTQTLTKVWSKWEACQ